VQQLTSGKLNPDIQHAVKKDWNTDSPLDVYQSRELTTRTSAVTNNPSLPGQTHA